MKIIVIDFSECKYPLDLHNEIREKLELPEFEKTIYIEDVASEKDIERAQYLRKHLGKHVIPVPTVEIKKQFSGYFLNPLKISNII